MTIYIPQKLKVGFLEREDTFNGKLSYINYLNNKNKWALDRSWENWRDKSIEPLFIDNNPCSGFVIHKGHKRYNDFSGSSVNIRIYHPNGFEFEITPSNLCAVLTHSNTSAGFINQECVLGWSGGKVVLLPTNSDIYKDSIEITQGLKDKFLGELEVGHYYNIKGNANVKYLYLGKFLGYKIDKNNRDHVNIDEKKKEHYFLEFSSDSYASEYECESTLITLAKSKIWRDVGQEHDVNVYASKVNDLQMYEKQVQTDSVSLIEFEEVESDKKEKVIDLIIKEKITSAFSLNNQKITDDITKDILKKAMDFNLTEDEGKILNNFALVSKSSIIELFNTDNIGQNGYYGIFVNFWPMKNEIMNIVSVEKGLVDKFSSGRGASAFFNGTFVKIDGIKVTEKNFELPVYKKFEQELIKTFCNDFKVVKNVGFYKNSNFRLKMLITMEELKLKFANFLIDFMKNEEVRKLIEISIKKVAYKNETILKMLGI